MTDLVLPYLEITSLILFRCAVALNLPERVPHDELSTNFLIDRQGRVAFELDGVRAETIRTLEL